MLFSVFREIDEKTLINLRKRFHFFVRIVRLLIALFLESIHREQLYRFTYYWNYCFFRNC